MYYKHTSVSLATRIYLIIYHISIIKHIFERSPDSGYKLTMLKGDDCIDDDVLSLVKEYVDSAEIESSTGQQLTCKLPGSDISSMLVLRRDYIYRAICLTYNIHYCYYIIYIYIIRISYLYPVLVFILRIFIVVSSHQLQRRLIIFIT